MSTQPARRPNILFILTDQERTPQHWPAGWAEANLPAMERIKAHGLSFETHFTASSMCTPSRAALFTGVYPPECGVPLTLDNQGEATSGGSQPPLSHSFQNLAKVLASADYDVFYKGKIHLTYPVRYDEALGAHWWSQADVAQLAELWGFKGWNAPDCAQTNLQGLGGGSTNNDGRTVDGTGLVYAPGTADLVPAPQPLSELESALHFLRTWKGERPFCLVVALVNPHDIWAHPGTGAVAQGSDVPVWEQGGYRREDFADLPIDLPQTWDEDLATKPFVQGSVRSAMALGLGELKTHEDRLDYVRFYAYLHTVVDQQVGRLLDALDARGLTDDTLIVRTSDHGELGLSHGGLRQKMGTAYDEMTRVPLVFSNPRMFPRPQTTRALSCSVDLLPTLAEIGRIPRPEDWTFRGRSLLPILQDPEVRVQDAVHFTYDDVASTYPVKRPAFIRCIREAEWKYVLYFDPFNGYACQYELYDLVADPLERTNLAHARFATPESERQRQRLHQRLLEMMRDCRTTPDRVRLPQVSGVDPTATRPATFVQPEVVEIYASFGAEMSGADAEEVQPAPIRGSRGFPVFG